MSFRHLAGTCVLLSLSASAAAAQAPRGPTAGFAVAAAPARGRLVSTMIGSARLGVSQPSVPAAALRDPLAPVRAPSLRHRGPGVALMLVGAAGVVTGLLLEENIITILGAGTGLVGLYLYLR